jgi:hypothetical protein
MAILWADSFDHYGESELATRYDYVDGVPAFVGIDASNGRFGTSCFDMSRDLARGIMKLIGDQSTVVVGLAFKQPINSHPDSRVPINIGRGTGILAPVQGVLVVNGVMGIDYYSGDGDTLLASATTMSPLQEDVYYYIELKVVIHPSAGSVVVRVNEEEVINQTSVNTDPLGSGSANRVAIGFSQVGTSSGRPYFIDDFYIEDTDFLGDIHIEALFPNAVGDASEWSPSTGGADNYTMTDEEPPDGDTTYVLGSAVDQKDSYGLINPTVQYTDIKAIQVDFYETGEAGIGTPLVVPDLYVGGTHYEGSLGISTIEEYRYRTEVIASNPQSTTAWTKADIDDLEVGPKIKST